MQLWHENFIHSLCPMVCQPSHHVSAQSLGNQIQLEEHVLSIQEQNHHSAEERNIKHDWRSLNWWELENTNIFILNFGGLIQEITKHISFSNQNKTKLCIYHGNVSRVIHTAKLWLTYVVACQTENCLHWFITAIYVLIFQNYNDHAT